MISTIENGEVTLMKLRAGHWPSEMNRCECGLMQCSELDRPHYFWSCPTTDSDFEDPLGLDHRNQGSFLDGRLSGQGPQSLGAWITELGKVSVFIRALQ